MSLSRLSRRDLLKLGLLGGGVALLPTGSLLRALGADPTSAAPDSPAFTPFVVPLPIPKTIMPVASNATTDFFEIRQVATTKEILPGFQTPVWAYNGQIPGPTFRVRSGQSGRKAVVTHVNNLTQAVTGENDGARFNVPQTGVFTTTHLHGGNVAARDDGNPVLLVLPGENFTYNYPNIQPAATLWYHDHALFRTGRNVYMGLAGLYIITDDDEARLEQGNMLPSGDAFDIPLIIQDRAFNRDGSLFFPTQGPDQPLHQGVFGDVILVNGAPKPVLKVQRRQYRFRILNGSNARFYNLVLSTGDPFRVIGTEDSLVKYPVETHELFITSSERYSIVVDFSKYPMGTKVFLENTIAPDPFGDPVDPAKVRQIMLFEVGADATDPVHVPDVLLPNMPDDLGLPDAASVRERIWRFDRNGGEWTINQQTFGASPFTNGQKINFDNPADDGRLDAFPAFDTIETWEFHNNSGGWLHPAHPHLVRFRVISRNGEPPRPWEVGGRKDTVSLGPNEVVRVIMKFESFDGRYVFHCHNTEHEDADMMTQFKVVR